MVKRLGLGLTLTLTSLRAANGEESLVEQQHQDKTQFPWPHQVAVTVYSWREEKSPEHTRQGEVEVEKQSSIHCHYTQLQCFSVSNKWQNHPTGTMYPPVRCTHTHTHTHTDTQCSTLFFTATSGFSLPELSHR